MGGGVREGRRASCEEVAPGAGAIVDGAAHDIPSGGGELPLVDENGAGEFPDALGVGPVQLALSDGVQSDGGGGPASQCLGLAYAFGAVDGDGGKLGKELVFRADRRLRAGDWSCPG